MLKWIALCTCLFVSLPVFLWERVLEVGWLGQRVNAYDILLDAAKFPCIGVIPFCIPIIKLWEYLFPKVLPIKYDVKVLGFCQYDRWEIASHCSFNLHFSYSKVKLSTIQFFQEPFAFPLLWVASAYSLPIETKIVLLAWTLFLNNSGSSWYTKGRLVLCDRSCKYLPHNVVFWFCLWCVCI